MTHPIDYCFAFICPLIALPQCVDYFGVKINDEQDASSLADLSVQSGGIHYF